MWLYSNFKYVILQVAGPLILWAKTLFDMVVDQHIETRLVLWRDLEHLHQVVQHFTPITLFSKFSTNTIPKGIVDGLTLVMCLPGFLFMGLDLKNNGWTRR